MGIMQLDVDSDVTNNTESVPTVLATPRESLFTTLFPESVADGLTKYVEGYPWSARWYGHLTSQTNTLEHFDPLAPTFTQPVFEVQDMILHVETPLNPNYEQSDGTTRMSGSAIVPLGIIPNVGDFFIAQVDTGEDAIMCVTIVERRSHRKGALYVITYSLHSYLNQHPAFFDAIQKRIQQTYFFNKDTNYFNRDYLITPTVKEARDRLKTFMRESQEYYLSTFSNRGAGTIMLPGMEYSVYDPLLLEFIGRFIDHDIKIHHPWYQHRHYDRYLQQKTIYDLLMERSPAMAGVINKSFGFVRSSLLQNAPRFGTVACSGVDYILYPKNPQTHNDIGRFQTRSPVMTFSDVHRDNKGYFLPALFISTDGQPEGSQKPLLHHLFEEDSYVVSPYFYEHLKSYQNCPDKVSFLEVLMARFIRREAIALEDLVRISQTFYEWGNLHQLYLLPVVWLMIRASL